MSERTRVQRKRAADRSVAPSLVEETLRAPGRPLDPAIRAFMEPRFGQDFSSVRVHTRAQAAESATAVNALAYAVGQDVVFGAGQYQPGTDAGKRLIAHELTHVVQQSPAIQLSNITPITTFAHAENLQRSPITIPEVAIVGHPNYYQQAQHANTSYAKHPPSSGWPYSERLNMIWQRGTHDDFADAVAEYQVVVMGLGFDRADGILGPRTAASMRTTNNMVIYTGSHTGTLHVIKGGVEIFSTNAVSGDNKNGMHGEWESNISPIPRGIYYLNPQLTQPPVTNLQFGTCGVRGISAGYQEIACDTPSLCSEPNHYCTVHCPTATRPDQTCFTPKDCWGVKRIRIEGSVNVATPQGEQVMRGGFFIHGGNAQVGATSGCIKVFDDSVFQHIRKLPGRMPLRVGSAVLRDR